MSDELTKTKADFELALNDAQLQIMSQVTPLEAVRFRQGRGGKQLAYTDTAYVIRTLNRAFNWDWDFEADNEEILYIYPEGEKRPYEVRCRGRLTVRINGHPIVKTQFGCQPLEFMQNDRDKPVSLGDAFKGAASDALKKCASLLGIALDLYDSDSAINSNPVKAQQQQKQQPARAPIVVEQPKATPPPNGQPVMVSQEKTEPLKPYKFPNTASEKFWKEAQAATNNYYTSPYHLIAAIGGNWFNFGDANTWAEKLSVASDHARIKSAPVAEGTQDALL